MRYLTTSRAKRVDRPPPRLMSRPTSGETPSGKPLIVTTNLSALDLKDVKDLDYKRVYDRLLPACYPIKMVGPSRRITEAEKNRAAFEKLLGL